jgi:hypothetical protein
MSSCSGADCTNGIKDGNEIEVDCGGDCPTCQPIPTSTEQSLSGIWYQHYSEIIIASFSDTTFDFPTGPSCKMDLTLEKVQPNHPQWRAYGSVWNCTYSGATGWWINETSGYFNDNFIIDTLTTNRLVIRTYFAQSDGNHTIYHYHR